MLGSAPLPGHFAGPLTEAELDSIHAASLHILQRVGMVIEDTAATRLLLRSGADSSGDRVLFPASMVDRALKDSPHRVELFARDPACDLILGEGRVHFTSGYGATFVLDLEDDAFRPARLEDMRQAAVLADALDMVHYCLLSVIPQDVPGEEGELAATAILLATTTKHVGPSLSSARLYPRLLELARLAARDVDHLPISLGCTVSSPLVFSADSIARMRICAENNIPFRVVSAPLAGATAPATLAGVLAQQNAEVLAGFVLGQLMRPGTPLIYGTFASAADMRTGKIALGGPELALLNAASAQLCRRYHVPLGYGTGGTCDSPLMDEQAGAERMMTLLVAASAGVEVIHDAVGGLLGSAMCFSPVQMVMDNELCQGVTRVLRGIDVSDEALALDVITAVGPKGHFLAEPHTVRNYRKEHFLPRLANRASVNEWYASADLPAMRDAARARARHLLVTHRPELLEPSAIANMNRVLAEAGVPASL